MQPQRVWITGADGLIGSWLVRTVPLELRSKVIGLTRRDADLVDDRAFRALFERAPPDLVIHCAALSRSPACEANPALARLVNVDATARLSRLLGDSRLVFFSTDLVFDGGHGNYKEDAQVSPLGVYAATKADAEKAVLLGSNHMVIRTSLNGGDSPTGDRGFNEQMRAAWKAGRSLQLFHDEYRNPISAEITARAVWELALTAPPGIYHVAGSERLSRFRIGKMMAARWTGLNPQIQPASLKEYKGAPRAPDTSLDCGKAQRLLSFPLPAFSEWLAGQPPGSF